MKKILIGILIGFLLHKVTFEIATTRAAVVYVKCTKEAKKNEDMEAALKCGLRYNAVEQVLLYQLNLWQTFPKLIGV